MYAIAVGQNLCANISTDTASKLLGASYKDYVPCNAFAISGRIQTN